MSDFQLKTPVAFIIFNRPDTTKLVFSEIAKAKPSTLLVVGDGPRPNRPGEAAKVAECRRIIELVDWDCEVITNFSDVNLGCKGREASGIDWIFEKVNEAIILEDDCLPHNSFFRYCEELLERYRNDQRVGMISGNNFQMGHTLNSDSYYFSRYSHGWGWATWRDRWQNDYDVEMKNWPQFRDSGLIKNCFDSNAENRYWQSIFEKTYRNIIDTYDYQWYFSFLLNGRLSILPNINLVSNIGFGHDATHTTGSGATSALPVGKMEFPLIHPIGMLASRTLDKRFFKKFVYKSIYKRAFDKILRTLKIIK